MTESKSNSSNLTALLFRQYWIYHSRLILTSILGLTGGLFVLLYSIQIFTRFDTWRYEHFMNLFMGFFTVMAVIYSGSSFPGLRSREKMYNYLSLPVTITQKYLFELFTRVILFILIIPGLYWCIFHLEGNLVRLVHPEFTFQSFSFTQGFHLPTDFENNLVMIMVTSELLLFVTVPFFGATFFRKQPIIKTVAAATIILFVHLVGIYMLQKSGIKPSRIEFHLFVTSYLLLINFGMVVLAYFKLKSKQI